MFAIIL